MAEKFLQSRLYEYGANSNLVLESEGRRRVDEPKGEVESLRGRVTKIKMGDRLKDRKVDPQDSDFQAAKRQKVTIAVNDKAPTKKVNSLLGSANNILESADELSGYHYTPKSAESMAAYEELLLFTQQIIGDQPSEVLKSAANEILSILKDGYHDNNFKQKEISSLLSVPVKNFGDLLRIGNRISDYKTSQGLEDQENQPLVEDIAVVFDDDEKVEDEDEEDEEEDEEGEDGGAGTHARLKGALGNDVQGQERHSDLSIHDIDAYWLQRQLSKYYSDANTSAKLAEETLAILANPDERVCENKLVFLLEFDKFELIKKLLNHRAKIYYCVRLKQAQTEQDRLIIEKEMENDVQHGGQEILRLLQQKASAESWTQDRMGEMALKARKEAMAISGEKHEAVTIEEEMDPKHSSLPGMVNFEKNLNLSDYMFSDGSHLMTNTRCELPEKSWRAQKKGYEEVHVPALKPILAAEDQLKAIASLPSWMHEVFKGVKHLNRVQSKMADFALNNQTENVLLCAPTGSGKTIVALLCMLGLISQFRDPETGVINLSEFKIVYIAPMKALVQECVQNFSKRLECFGMVVNELSGDQSLSLTQINETHVIVTTPEKWDIVTRKAGDRTYTKLVRLVLIDEIHLLHDDRGAALESIVARVHRYVESGQNSVRIVGLSATLPNYEDVAAFLRVKPDKGLFFFDNSYRPVPLQQQFIGITERKAVKRVQLMNEICYEKVLLHAGKNQVLIFTHSRADTAKTARALVEMATTNDTLGRFVQEGSASFEILKSETDNVKSADLKELLKYGFAIHHAGLVRSDRTLVEDLFADKHVQVLVSTATLAWGVNLPCHTVIIKGTQMYLPEKGGWTELSPLDILQMMGRAGRYGLDSEGEGIILTNHSELQYYLSLMNQQLPIESQLVKKLAECLNSEIVLGTVNNLMEAASWIGYTFLYIRMLRRPQLYGISADHDPELDPTLLKRRLELAYAAITVLERHDLVKFDRKSGMLQSTDLGRIASYFYISNESIATYTDLMRPTMNEVDLLRVFSLSSEFKFLRVREEEKLELTKLLARVPIPIKESVEESSAKVNVLLQSYISRLKLEGFAIASDMIFIQQSAGRLLRALYEIALRKGWALLSLKILDLCVIVERRLWRSQSPLRQFTAIPEMLIRKLEKISDVTWDKYLVLKPQDFGEMVKMPKMGKTLHKFVHMIPRLAVDANAYPMSRSVLHIEINLKSDFEYNESIHGHQILFWLRIEDGNAEKILHYEPIIVQPKPLKKDSNNNNAVTYHWEHSTQCVIQLLDPLPPQYFLRVLSDRWLHSMTMIPITFHHLTLPNKFFPPTEVLDLNPFPVSSFNSKQVEEFFTSTTNSVVGGGRVIDTLNSLQTQSHFALYENPDNVVFCAPNGSGKTVCAELAILRHCVKQLPGKTLYITPHQEQAEQIYVQWKEKFGKIFDKTVILLSGDLNRDQAILKGNSNDQNDVILISTPEKWNLLSKKWKGKKFIHNITLYVFDDLHFIGQVGADEALSMKALIYETIIARARFMSSQFDLNARFIGLSYSIPNASDVGSWLGVSSSNMIFNFPADCRPGPVHIAVHTIDNYELHHRLQAMAKPVYDNIVKYSDHNLTVVFVPSRKQAQITAIDLIGYANASSGKTKRYRFTHNKLNEEQIDYFQQQDSLLGSLLTEGIGYVHEGFSKKEIALMESYCEQGLLRVLLVPYAMSYSLTLSASLVIVMDTVTFDGVNNQYIDLPPHYLWQMVGKADCHSDYESRVTVFCSTYKKDQLRRLLHESSYPLESYFDQFLKEMITDEVVNGTIETLTDAVDYLTWTFYYHRLSQNPNFYRLTGTTVRHISDHLSELVENSVTELQECKLLALEEEINVLPLNLGMIASFYGLSSSTIDMMATAITEKAKIRGIIDIITTAAEYHSLLLRYGEVGQLKKLGYDVAPKYPNLPLDALSTASGGGGSEDESLIKCKVIILLLCHLLRHPMSYEFLSDCKTILSQAVNLIHALIDVIASQGWLKSALSAMELCQFVVQGLWENDSVLLQLPHFTSSFIQQRLLTSDVKVETVFDIIDLEDEDRVRLFQGFSKRQLADIAAFCNSYPYIDVSYQLSFENEIVSGETVTVLVKLQREIDEDDEEQNEKIGLVSSPRYPLEKFENWWVIVGDVKGNNLFAIKKVTIQKKATVSSFLLFLIEFVFDFSFSLFIGEVRVLCSSSSW